MTIKLLGMVLCLGLLLGSSPVLADEPFAVVELFGSEGCSSCPAADDLLRQINKEAQARGERVFTLSYAVDYWNHLGWVDPLSSAQFTQRQYDYAAELGSHSVYTPQMIVNGKDAFVGSDSGKARKFIRKALETSAYQSLVIKVDRQGDQVSLSYKIVGLDKNNVIRVALVEDGIESRVLAGENAGALLKHDHAVRDFRTIMPIGLEGQVTLPMPLPKGSGSFWIIAFLQNKQKLHILAAQAVRLS